MSHNLVPNTKSAQVEDKRFFKCDKVYEYLNFCIQVKYQDQDCTFVKLEYSKCCNFLIIKYSTVGVSKSNDLSVNDISLGTSYQGSKKPFFFLFIL